MKKKNTQGVSQIGRYEIRKELGRGTMGVVYEAHDPALGRTIALKTIQPTAFASDDDREEYEKRFLAEARIAARLSHPGVVVVHDVGRDPGGTLYIALEYLHGRTLEERVSSQGALPWREALRIMGRIASALHYAHAEGVVHRDIKPANIMVLRSGEPKIMDFGIAKHEAGHVTAAGRLFGTPLYMAPEQARGEPVDARSDLFSLGSVAYMLLTGRPPFDAPNVPGILARVESKNPRPPSELVPDLPSDVDDMIARAMAKSPGDRYPDGATLAEDIEDVLAGRPPRHRPEWTPPARANGTLISAPIPARSNAAEAELPLLEEAPKPAARRRRRTPAPILVLVFGLTVAGWFVLHAEDRVFWRNVLSRVERSPLVQEAIGRFRSLEPPPAPEPGTTPVDAPPGSAARAPVRAQEGLGGMAAGPPPGAPPPAPQAVETSAPEGDPIPPEDVIGPVASAATPAAPYGAPATVAPGRLMVDFEHHLKRGTLRVWIDDKLALDEDFDSRRTRKILAFELREGLVQEVLTLPPGEHEVRVRVRWDDNVRTARIAGGFRSGTTRRLDVTVARITGKLSLEWK